MSRNSEIALCVEQALDRYFKDLDGEQPNDVYGMVLRQIERPMLESVLRRTRGNQTQAAEILGINRNTLRRKLSEHGLI
ncbi:helix-turn-helix domain-containing protein [Uliginosibacterium sp. H1]|uniref:helix-turn-helix domain-containing protein n=1 Tax=Uliginosibacterium sp. H1 TaxID=3114757 RepID=UPI0028094A08|nr:helix-turn-helix domain-containing protein [Moraxellaceae bacterium]MEC5399579.1 helix-turn-helix domain-containing protein [Uliginosibacterium sp. H1]